MAKTLTTRATRTTRGRMTTKAMTMTSTMTMTRTTRSRTRHGEHNKNLKQTDSKTDDL